MPASFALVFNITEQSTVFKNLLTATSSTHNGFTYKINAEAAAEGAETASSSIELTSWKKTYKNLTALQDVFNIGQNVIGFEITPYSDGDNGVQINWYLNDTYIAGTTSGVGSYYSNASWEDLNVNEILSSVDGTLFYSTTAVGETGFKALPEPTAVALLALGVAGLALKRKVK